MNIITQSKQTFEDYISNFTKNIKINGLKQLKEELERIDLLLTYKRPKTFKIVGLRNRQILTTIGLLSFKRIYYFNEKTQEYLFFLDAVLGIPKREKIDNRLKLRLINAASKMSYRKDGIYGSDEQYPVSNLHCVDWLDLLISMSRIIFQCLQLTIIKSTSKLMKSLFITLTSGVKKDIILVRYLRELKALVKGEYFLIAI